MTEKRLFLDKNHNKVSEEKAEWLVVHTYDEKGKLVKERWVDLKQSS